MNAQRRTFRTWGCTLAFLAAAFPIIRVAAQTRPPARVPSRIAADTPIQGVQPAALDQPRIYLSLRRTASGPILRTGGDQPGSSVEAFLDTGASGIMLSADTVKKTGINQTKTASGEAIVFEDVGIAGSETFGVTEPLFFATAKYPNADPEVLSNYSKPSGPFRAEIRPAGGLLELIAPGMDVAGMPMIAGKVVVIDPAPLTKLDKIHTAVLDPGDSGIPKTSRTVPLTLVSFVRFTRIQPAGASGPNLVANPMIGPDPFAPAGSRKPVVIRHGNKSASATFLLDTGAASSVISTKLARQLGINVAADGALPDIPPEQQFQLTVGGLGGGKSSAGLFFDRLELPTREGPSIVFAKAPLMVSDVTAVDHDGKAFTLDGVLGMNYLVASVELSGGLLPDIGKIVNGPFKWIVIDLKQNLLGLDPG